jgi:hypothetical protein
MDISPSRLFNEKYRYHRIIPEKNFPYVPPFFAIPVQKRPFAFRFKLSLIYSYFSYSSYYSYIVVAGWSPVGRFANAQGGAGPMGSLSRRPF